MHLLILKYIPFQKNVYLFWKRFTFWNNMHLFWNNMHLFWNNMHLFWNNMHLFWNNMHLFWNNYALIMGLARLIWLLYYIVLKLQITFNSVLLLKIRITSKKASNESCSKLNFVLQKSLRAHMSISSRSGAMAFERLIWLLYYTGWST